MLSNREIGAVSGLALLSLTLGAFTTPPELGCEIGFAVIAVGWAAVTAVRWILDRRVNGARSSEPGPR